MNKLEMLKNYLKELGEVAIAFSGGVDSTFLLSVASEVLGEKAVAITIVSPYIPRWEIEEAKELTASLGCKHLFINIDSIPESIKFNPKEKCYLCKSILFKKIYEEANKLGIKYVLDGTNIDDTKDYRPGLKALEELSVKSPLKELNITKNEIRMFSKELNLKTWNKPAYACLLTRMEVGVEITNSKLRKIEEAELILHRKGFKAVRVRTHGDDLARIEMDPNLIERVLEKNILKELAREIKNVGFKFVTLDMEGYKVGSLNGQEIN